MGTMLFSNTASGARHAGLLPIGLRLCRRQPGSDSWHRSDTSCRECKPCRLRAQPHKTTPGSYPSRTSHPPARLQIGVPPAPFSVSISGWNGSQNSRKHLILTNYPFIMEDTTRDHPDARDRQGKVWGRGCRAPTRSAPRHAPQLEALQIPPHPLCRGFMEVPLPRCDR